MITNPFTPNGRMRRLQYAGTILVANILGVMLREALSGTTPAEAVITFAGMMIILWPLYCSMSKRLHDADKPSIPALVALGLAIASSIFAQTGETLMTEQIHLADGLAALTALGAGLIALYILIAPPTRGPNRYGEDPRAPEFIETPIDGPPPSAYDGV